jgi:hypothetical protein
MHPVVPLATPEHADAYFTTAEQAVVKLRYRSYQSPPHSTPGTPSYP